MLEGRAHWRHPANTVEQLCARRLLWWVWPPGVARWPVGLGNLVSAAMVACSL